MFAAGAHHNQAMSCLIDPDALPELDRMCRKFPDTPVIIDHLCRIGVNGTIGDKEVDAFLPPWQCTKKSWSRSGHFMLWARSSRPIPTWPR